METLFLFPGQGSQYPGMAKDLHAESKSVRELFELASDTVGINCEKLLFDSSEETLARTLNTQIAVALADRSVSVFLRERGVSPSGTGGFSLGEWPAMVEAGILSEKDMFLCLKMRAELMEEAVNRLDGGGGMSAVLALSPKLIEDTLLELGIDDVFVANYNSETQTVISGNISGLVKAEDGLKARGAKRVVRLRVSGPFHSPLIHYAQEGLMDALKDLVFIDPKIKFYSNVDGKRVNTGAEAKANCIAQVCGAVRWTTQEATMDSDGFAQVLECGPGSVLAGLWKAYTQRVSCQSLGKVDTINAYLEGAS